MEKQYPFEALTFQLPAPGQDARCHDWKRRNRRCEQIIIGHGSERAILPPLGEEIEAYTDEK